MRGNERSFGTGVGTISFEPRHHPSAVERGEHGARNVCALKTARGEFAVRQAREILVGERHGPRLLDAGQERGEAGEGPDEQAGNGSDQGGQCKHGHVVFSSDSSVRYVMLTSKLSPELTAWQQYAPRDAGIAGLPALAQTHGRKYPPTIDLPRLWP